MQAHAPHSKLQLTLVNNDRLPENKNKKIKNKRIRLEHQRNNKARPTNRDDNPAVKLAFRRTQVRQAPPRPAATPPATRALLDPPSELAFDAPVRQTRPTGVRWVER